MLRQDQATNLFQIPSRRGLNQSESMMAPSILDEFYSYRADDIITTWVWKVHLLVTTLVHEDQQREPTLYDDRWNVPTIESDLMSVCPTRIRRKTNILSIACFSSSWPSRIQPLRYGLTSQFPRLKRVEGYCTR